MTLTGVVYRIDEYGKVRRQIADNRPVKTISLRPTAKKKGLLTAASSLREAFLGRESPWKPGSGAIEGEVTTKGGRVSVAWPAHTACETAGSSSTGALFRVSSAQKTEKGPISFSCIPTSGVCFAWSPPPLMQRRSAKAAGPGVLCEHRRFFGNFELFFG